MTPSIPLYSLMSLVITQAVSLDESSMRRFQRSPGLFDKLGSVTPAPLPNLDPTSMLDSLRDEIKKMGTISEGLEKALEIEKKARLDLQNFVDNIKDKIESLENAVFPDETSYWNESTSCGGVIVSQTGRITYKLDTSYEHYEKCVWTVRTNHRSLVKVQLISHGLESGYDHIIVTEVRKDVAPRSFKLEHKGKYVLGGPLFLVTFISDGSGVGNGFQLEFEGVGVNINKDVAYKHFHINDASGTFSYENLTDFEDSETLNVPTLRNPSQEVTTVVFNPNIKNATQLSVTIIEEVLNLQPNTCDIASLSIYDYLAHDISQSRCCGTKCENTSALRNNDGIFLALIHSPKPQPDSTFQMAWNTREDVAASNSVDTCGGTISGRFGRISYKIDKDFDNNERCVWAIQPAGKSKIKMLFRSQQFEDGYDYVSVSTFDNNSEIRTIKVQEKIVYNFNGSVILVTFYSDNSHQGKGFDLDWEEFGDLNVTPSNDPVYFDQDSGTISLSLESETNQVIVINPKYLDRSSVHLKLNAFESLPHSNQDGYDKNDSTGLFVFANDEETYTLAQMYGEPRDDGIVPEEFGAIGGVFVLLVKINNPDSVTKLELTWRKGALPMKPDFGSLQYVNSTDKCGEPLVGDAGHIEYKLDSPYEENARCTWIVESTRLSKISFKLIKDGFESCCDFLILTPLNTETGTLGESVIMNREKRVQSFSTPVVFVTFHSDPSLGHHGLRLDFTTSGNEILTKRVQFFHSVWRDIPGSISFTPPEEIDETDGNETVKIYTHVLNSKMDSTPMIPITLHLNTTNFQVDDTCRRDSLALFQVGNPQRTKRFSQIITCSEDRNSCACPPTTITHEKVLQMEENFFILIFKSLEPISKASFLCNWTVADSTAHN